MSTEAPVTVEARSLTFEYRRGQTVLEDWSATFEPGTMTALTGPSGRGKSTLLYILGLMLAPTSGDVMLHGVGTREKSDITRARLRASAFGFVFQDAALDATRSVLDNITETALYRGEPRKQWMPRAEQLMEDLGVDVPGSRKPGQISGGQAQRIALCRALLTSPPLLLADEPTGNLDPPTAQLVVSTLREHARAGATVVIVTHSRDVASVCDYEIEL